MTKPPARTAATAQPCVVAAAWCCGLVLRLVGGGARRYPERRRHSAGVAMTDELAFMLTIGVAAACGAATGRIFAAEGEDRRTSILAASYCGAGAGILGAPLFAFALILTVKLLDGETAAVSALARAGEAVGPALLWGAAGGAGGGLLAGIVVALFKRYAPSPH